MSDTPSARTIVIIELFAKLADTNKPTHKLILECFYPLSQFDSGTTSNAAPSFALARCCGLSSDGIRRHWLDRSRARSRSAVHRWLVPETEAKELTAVVTLGRPLARVRLGGVKHFHRRLSRHARSALYVGKHLLPKAAGLPRSSLTQLRLVGS